MTKHIIDAEGKKVGRVASEVAVLLMGKNLPEFTRNSIPEVSVEIVNTAKADITESKLSQKTYNHFSGYPGGLRQPTMEQVIEKKGHGELFKSAVSGMLPKNKLRQKMMNNLKIS